LDCGSLLPLSASSLLRYGRKKSSITFTTTRPSISVPAGVLQWMNLSLKSHPRARSGLRSQSGSRLPQSKELRATVHGSFSIHVIQSNK